MTHIWSGVTNVVISGSTKCCIIEDWWRIYGRVLPTLSSLAAPNVVLLWTDDAYMVGCYQRCHLWQHQMLYYWGLMTHIWLGVTNVVISGSTKYCIIEDWWRIYGRVLPTLSSLAAPNVVLLWTDDAYMVGCYQRCHPWQHQMLYYWGLMTHIWSGVTNVVISGSTKCCIIVDWWRIYGWVLPTLSSLAALNVVLLRIDDAYMDGCYQRCHLWQHQMLYYCGLMTHIWSGVTNVVISGSTKCCIIVDWWRIYGRVLPTLSSLAAPNVVLLRIDDAYMVGCYQRCHLWQHQMLYYWGLMTHIWLGVTNVVISGSTKCCIIEDWWRIYGRVLPTLSSLAAPNVVLLWTDDAYMVGCYQRCHLWQHQMLYYWGLMTHIWSGDTNVVISGSTKCCIIEDWWRIYGRVLPTLSSLAALNVVLLRIDDAYMVGWYQRCHLWQHQMLYYWGLMTHIWSGVTNVVISGSTKCCIIVDWWRGIWTGDTNPSLNPLRPDDTFMMDMTPIRHLTYWRLMAHLWWVWYQLVI